MSDQLFKKKETEEFKHKEETESKFQTTSAPVPVMEENELTGDQDEALAEKIKKDFETTGVDNRLSNIGKQNLEKIENGQEPVLDTRYIDNEQGYREKYETENLENLRAEFQQERYKKKGFLWGYRSDSGEMKAIQDRLYELTTNMYERRLSLSDSAAVDEFFQMYRSIIEDCNTYLGSATKGYSKIGKLRRSMVERIRTTCMREINILPSIINSERESQRASKNEAPISFRDLLRKARSIQLGGDGENKFEILGEGLSTVIKYKQDDKTYFFKEDDTFKKHNTDTIMETLKEEQKTLVSTKTLKQKDCEKAAENIETLLRYLDEDVKSKIISEDLKNHLLKGMLEKLPRIPIEKIRFNEEHRKKIMDLYNGEGSSRFFDFLKKQVIPDIREKSQSRADAYQQSFIVVRKTLLAEGFLSNTVKLPVGAKITTNNVATSRMAQKLNISDIVAKSQSAIININGKTLIGNVMEEAKGGFLNDIETQNELLAGRLKVFDNTAERYARNAYIIKSWNSRTQTAIRAELRSALEKLGVTVAKNTSYEELKRIAMEVPDYKNVREITRYITSYDEYEDAIKMNKQFEASFLSSKELYPEQYKDLGEYVELKKQEEKEPTLSDYVDGYLKVKKKYKSVKTYLSGNVKKQMMNLGIFDYIMGQVDRHYGNFFVTTEKKGGRIVITGLKAIDNDACCGLLKSENINKDNMRHNMSRIKDEDGKVLVPYMDSEFAESILNLSVEELAHEMIDLLSKEQIAAMADRLKSVQDLIRSEQAKAAKGKNTMKFISGDQWEDVGKAIKDRAPLNKYNSFFFSEKYQMAEL